jgi:hypothetical protein
MILKFRRFASFEEIQQKAITGLRAVPEKDLEKFFQQRQDSSSKCVRSEWWYFDGDYVSFFYICPSY